MKHKKDNKHEKKADAPKTETKKSELELLKEKNTELTKTVQYVHAEFQNYKKRIERDQKDHVQSANKNLILNILPVLDNFELAIKTSTKHLENNTEGGQCVEEEFLKGMELIYSQMQDILKKEGVEAIDVLDCKFDPYRHECLMQGDSDKESQTILEEFQKGYLMKDKVIRHSKVKVAK